MLFRSEFFKDVAYILQCDRRGNTNLITKTNGIEVMSDEMFAEMLDICEEYGYSEESGTSTDVGCLLKRGIGVSGCNISCGYFSEHTGNELTHIPSLENCMNLVYHFITTLGCVKYDHVPKPSYTSYVNYGTGHSTYSGGYNSKYANKAYSGMSDSYNKSDRQQYLNFAGESEEEPTDIRDTMFNSCYTCTTNISCNDCPHSLD